jgi:hypothetical protein
MSTQIQITSSSANFANTDLTFTGDRYHNTAGNDLSITTDNGGFDESFIFITPSVAQIGQDEFWTNYKNDRIDHHTSSMIMQTIASTGVAIGYNNFTAQAVLDVKAQGALNTDAVFRIRNSTDTINFARFSGDGHFSLRKNNNESIGIDNTFLSLSTGFSNLLFPLTAASTEVTFNTSSQGLRVNSSTGRFYVNNTTYNGSLWMIRTVVGIGGLLSTNDLSSVSNARGLTLLNGTPPTTNFEDRHWYYSADITAGNAAPHFRTENGSIIKLYQQSSSGISTVADIIAVLQNLGLLS